jgi:tetratricopeptide (TPR) repeat protein
MTHRIVRPTFVLVAALLSIACGNPAASTPTATADAGSAVGASASVNSAGPAAALAYAPDGSPTGERIAAAQAVLRERPDSVEAHLQLALLLMRRQRESSNAVLMRYAEDVLASARAIAPDHAEVKLLTAMTLQDGHRFRGAAELASEVIAAEPGNATAHLVLADARLELGEHEAAMDSVQAALNLHPDLRSYNRAAHLRWLVGDFDSALAIMELALDSGSPRDPEASAWCFVDLGAMFLHRGDAARALASTDRALALVPEYEPGLVLRARALARADRVPEAIATMQQAVERKPSVEDLLRLAEWHEQQGDEAAAATRRAEAERLADDDPRPLALDLARRGLEPERAVTLARKELEARRNVAAHDTLALALAREGRHEEALSSMKAALALGTKDANLHLHAALVHALAGRVAEARAAHEQARAIDDAADARLDAELRTRLGAA